MVRQIAALGIALAAVSACGGARAAKTSDPERTVIAVENQTFNDLTVFLINGGQRVRLGRVSAKQTTGFNVPSGIIPSAREVQILAEPASGSGAAISNRIWVGPGERVKLIIPG